MLTTEQREEHAAHDSKVRLTRDNLTTHSTKVPKESSGGPLRYKNREKDWEHELGNSDHTVVIVWGRRRGESPNTLHGNIN